MPAAITLRAGSMAPISSAADWITAGSRNTCSRTAEPCVRLTRAKARSPELRPFPMSSNSALIQSSCVVIRLLEALPSRESYFSNSMLNEPNGHPWRASCSLDSVKTSQKVDPVFRAFVPLGSREHLAQLSQPEIDDCLRQYFFRLEVVIHVAQRNSGGCRDVCEARCGASFFVD